MHSRVFVIYLVTDRWTDRPIIIIIIIIIIKEYYKVL